MGNLTNFDKHELTNLQVEGWQGHLLNQKIDYFADACTRINGS